MGLPPRTGRGAGRTAPGVRPRERRRASGEPRASGGPRASGEPRAADESRAAELARLAWPEAAGTSPEQREALELSVRHGLAPEEIAAVLGADPAATRTLLAAASCEVERTRAALSVVERGTCPSVARLTGDRRVLLSTALRTELVRHVDDCPRCRRAAERAEAAAPWPGTARPVPGPLPLVAPDRVALAAAFPAGVRPHRVVRTAPRFNREGFPMDPGTAPPAASGCGPAPSPPPWSPPSSPRRCSPCGPPTGARPRPVRRRAGARSRPARAGTRTRATAPAPAATTRTPAAPAPPTAPTSPSRSPPPAYRPGLGPRPLAVEARHTRGGTLITLTATGTTPVDWSARAGSAWLRLSRTTGTLAPGETVMLRVFVDADREPRGHWSARIAIGPHGAVVTVRGTAPPPASPAAPARPTRAPAIPARPTPAPRSRPTPAPRTRAPPIRAPRTPARPTRARSPPNRARRSRSLRNPGRSSRGRATPVASGVRRERA
ncbi:hypothetical protein OIM90_18275 [Streptomyces sp. AD16]|nr:hypothetical protein OIM90_18275 [Streptomyces sp. AD16]